MTERGTSAGDGSGPETRYHLLTTDGGIVPDQPGKMAGEAAIGVVLKAPLEEIAERIGATKDHHVAEYRALIRGLEAARSRGIGHLRVCLDSALVVNQLNGKSQVKAEHLKPLYDQAVSLIHQFADIKIAWVPREANAEADALASTPLGPLRAKPKPSIDELPLESAPEETETETEPEKPRKAKKSPEWKSLPPAEMAEHLLSHQTLADRTWTDEQRQKGEKRDAFIGRILLGETGETGGEEVAE
jgi:ribonuclease HI